MENQNVQILFRNGKSYAIPLTADGDECLGDLKICFKKCLAAAGGNEFQAELIYEAATNDGLPGYKVPVDLLDD